MTAQHDDVSGLADQAFHLESQLADLKKQVFHVADDLHMLYYSYEGLQVITSDSSAEATHCCAVLEGLNYRFVDLLKRLDVLYHKPEADAR